MEVKVFCGCGAKYKFDVEPVNGVMPYVVKCPVCSADGTAAANQIIQQNTPMMAAPPTSLPKTGLRVSAVAEAPPRPIEAPAPLAYRPPPPPKKSSEPKWKTIATWILIGFVAVGFCFKWARRLRGLSHLASAIGDATVDSASGDADQEHDNFFYAEEITELIIKHTNQTDVATACAEYFKTTTGKEPKLSTQDDESGVLSAENLFYVSPERHGAVMMLQNAWPDKDTDKLCEFLSQKFNTMVFVGRSSSHTTSLVFGAYENGEKKFRHELEEKINAQGDNTEEIVKTDGQEWALANGFKPDSEGFKSFWLHHGNRITLKHGVKFWDMKDDEKWKWTVLDVGVNKKALKR